MSNEQGSITPMQLLIEAQRSLATELIEQRKVNAALNESIYKLSTEIRILSSEIKKHDQLEDKVAEMSKEIQHLKNVIREDLAAGLLPIDNRVKDVEKSLWRVAGASGLLAFVIMAWNFFQPILSKA